MELERVNSRIRVTAYSPEVIGEVVIAKDYFVERGGGRSLDARAFGVSSDDLREWVQVWDEKSFALRFRSLNALYVPQG